VDTSTGVLSPAEHFCKLIKEHSPSSLIVLDAVCSVASEEIRFDDWGLDLVISATQKGLGAPPGMSVLMASGRAITVGSLFVQQSLAMLIVSADFRVPQNTSTGVLRLMEEVASDYAGLRGWEADVFCDS